MVLQKAKAEMPVAVAGFNGQAKEFFTIHTEGGTVVLNTDLDMIPLVRFQQMSRFGIFFNQRFDACLIHFIKLSVVAAETGGGIIIASITYIKEVQGIVIAEDSVAPGLSLIHI